MTRSRKVYILMRAGVIGPAPEPARDGGSFVCLSEKAHRLGHAEACPPVEGSKEVGLWVGGGACLLLLLSVLWSTTCSQFNVGSQHNVGSQQIDTHECRL